MIEAYGQFVKEHLLLASFLQFALLGMVGELCGAWIARKNFSMPFTFIQTLLKMLGWGLLGIIIKYAFVAFSAIPDAWIQAKLLSACYVTTFVKAFLISAVMNMLFGPQMMYFHRFTDNLIMKTKGYAGIEKSLFTLIWFWIPAHTVTFLLPFEYRIGLASVWSVVLGVIMGYYKRKSTAQ